jgi:hypothetical protein
MKFLTVLLTLTMPFVAIVAAADWRLPQGISSSRNSWPSHKRQRIVITSRIFSERGLSVNEMK